MSATQKRGTEPASYSSVSVLLGLPQHHPYRAVATGDFTPAQSNGAGSWSLARPVAVRLLADDVQLSTFNPQTAPGRRSALCGYLDWLATVDDRFLELPAVLADIHINRYLATDARQRRSSHRSRVALRSQLRSYRAAHAKLFPARRPRATDPERVLEPLEDWQYELASTTIGAFRSPATRVQLRALLLLCRGAGLDGRDLRWVTGRQILRRPSAGTWVHVPRPGAPRDVPVLARYADALEELAVNRPDSPLIGAGTVPVVGNQASALCGQLNRALARTRHTFSVSPEKLRKAWIAEHLGANVPMNTILAAAGLRSLRTVETLIAQHGPAAPTDATTLAYDLGALPARARGEQS